MPRLLDEPDLVRIQIRLPRDTYRRVLAIAHAAEDTSIGASTIIRKVVETWLNANEARVRGRIDALAPAPRLLDLDQGDIP